MWPQLCLKFSVPLEKQGNETHVYYYNDEVPTHVVAVKP